SPVQQLPNLLRGFAQESPKEQEDPSDERLLALLPQGTRLLRDQSGSLNVQTTAGTGALRVRMLNYTDPLAQGIYRQRDGRAPAGGLAMLEIVLLAGPAFAVGARRRQRELALISASGAAPAQVRRIVLADGVVLGSLAAVTGVVLGVLVAAASRPIVEDYLTRRSGEFRIFPLALGILVGAAVLTGVLAALVPAWISARQDVVTALAGRRGITRSRRRWAILGL